MPNRFCLRFYCRSFGSVRFRFGVFPIISITCCRVLFRFVSFMLLFIERSIQPGLTTFCVLTNILEILTKNTQKRNIYIRQVDECAPRCRYKEREKCQHTKYTSTRYSPTTPPVESEQEQHG